jgi:hypothetical protein
LTRSGLDRVLEKYGRRDRSDTARYWGQRPGATLNACGIHIAEYAAVIGRCGTDVDDDGTLRDVFRSNETRHSGRRDHDLGIASARGEIGGVPMTNGHGGVRPSEKPGRGGPDDGRSAHHGNGFAAKRDSVVIEQRQHRLCGGRRESREIRDEPSQADRIGPVDVLGGIDCLP